ncbi:hypothetical protein VMCG_02808 [Cytospora schulzeri]|uniref:Uncharacterized protein n=1 Tax=Cytospora schulzeri TaxID=448051 RepID=A0A423WZC8_9PEZI|nr:hypothetical protein VMCG_02808 [Valsa malicola]
MSAASSPSPLAGPATEPDDSKLPQGNCRYIMTIPEIKGNRCACVTFTLNKALPGALCECGHLACFHQTTAEPPIDKRELELLRQRVQQLEELLARGSEKETEMVRRVSELEGVVESRTEEIGQEIRKTYGNLNRAWHSIGGLERRSGEHENKFHNIGAHLKNVDQELRRLHERQCELSDADLSLEEQLLELTESMEEEVETTPTRGRQRHASIPRSTSTLSRSPEVTNRQRRLSSQRSMIPATVTTPIMPVRPHPAAPRSAKSATSELWTVHISLLPSISLPFPFERDTNAYKRCLSRGLHQVVAVNGTSSEAFVTAVSRAFGSLLRGRAWVPLQAKLCDAETLQGLPMLRPLGPSLLDAKFDMDFLRTHCAVLDIHGAIDSLYIAMRHNTLSWHALRRSPVFLQGLEASWGYDPMLDLNDPFEDDENVDESDRPSAGDLVGSLPNLKRAASEISRSSSFGASTATAVAEGAERPQKVPRPPCPPPDVQVRRPRVETA